jgi:hypothetical protein
MTAQFTSPLETKALLIEEQLLPPPEKTFPD